MQRKKRKRRKILLDFEASSDTVTINLVMNAWAKSNDTPARRRAEALLKRMESLSQSGSAHMKPTIQSYTIISIAKRTCIVPWTQFYTARGTCDVFYQNQRSNTACRSKITVVGSLVPKIETLLVGNWLTIKCQYVLPFLLMMA